MVIFAQHLFQVTGLSNWIPISLSNSQWQEVSVTLIFLWEQPRPCTDLRDSIPTALPGSPHPDSDVFITLGAKDHSFFSGQFQTPLKIFCLSLSFHSFRFKRFMFRFTWIEVSLTACTFNLHCTQWICQKAILNVFLSLAPVIFLSYALDFSLRRNICSKFHHLYEKMKRSSRF